MALLAIHKQTTFQVGDIVRLHLTAQEARRRQSVVEGQVLGIRGQGSEKSFIVRRIGAGNIGVEYIFPLQLPQLLQVDVVQKSGTGFKRAKLYYLRGRSKAAFEKITRRVSRKGKAVVPKAPAARVKRTKSSRKSKKTKK